MFKKVDNDNDDLIDYEEFLKSVEKIYLLIKDDRYAGKKFEKFRNAFINADENNDGLITADQFRFLFS